MQVSNDALKLVLDVSAALSSSMDEEVILVRMARACVPSFAEFCVVDRVEGQWLRRTCFAHADPSKEEALRRLGPPLHAEDASSAVGDEGLLWAGEREAIALDDGSALASFRDHPRLAAIACELSLVSLMAVPLLREEKGEPLGLWIFGSAQPGHRFTDEHLQIARGLAHTAAAAIENVQRYRESQGAREAAERAAEHMERLQSIIASLAKARTIEEVALVVVAETRAVLKAAGGYLALLCDGGRALEVCCTSGYKNRFREPRSRFSVDAPLPAAWAARTGKLSLLWEPEEMRAQYPAMPCPDPDGYQALSAIPLLAEGNRLLGVLELGYREPRSFIEADCVFMVALARQCTLAIERIRLFESERSARRAAERAADRSTRLQAVTAELSGALTPAQVAKIILEEGLDALGARAGALGLLTQDRKAIEVMQTRGSAGALLARATLLSLDAPIPMAEAVRRGAPVWVESAAEWSARYPGGVRGAPGPEGAWAGIPLVVNSRVIGGLSLYVDAPRLFPADERDFVLTLARQCTLALERACLFDAERRAREQIAFLAEANVLLASVSEYEETTAKLAHFAVPFFTDMCAIDVIDKNGGVRRLGAAHNDQSVMRERHDALMRPPLDRAGPLFRALESGKPEMVTDRPAAELADALWDPGGVELDEVLTPRAVLIIPLVFEGRTLGAISFGAAHRRFDVGDLAVAESLARRAAVAIDRARLYREAQEARQAAERATRRITQLQAITAAASEALTPKLVAEAVIHQTMASVGACAGGFGQVTDDGLAIELMGIQGYSIEEVDPARRIPIGARAPIPDVVREKAPIFLETAEDVIERYPKLAAMHTARRHGAMVVVPLIVEGRAIGGLGLAFPASREFSEDDRAFMNTLGRHCAQALQRARSYEAERRAHVAADEANRLKDEFLATLSHELRTPLTAILGWARMLRTIKSSEAVATRALETIERNASLQSRLIDDLLDASRIITGKLRLEVQQMDLGPVILAAIEAVSHAAHAKHIRITTSLDPSVGNIEGDPNRLQQVVWNLVSNAIKFTPSGGLVEITLDRVEREARICVTDSGAGIAPEFLPYVFDRFRQADSAITRSHGGLGLGLAIVRSLVDGHGGTVQAASGGMGKGTVFTVRLPLPSSQRAVSEAVEASASGSPRSVKAVLAGMRVLVVDDEPDSLELLGTVIESHGAEVEMASNAADALAVLTRFKPDVLISDIAMPDEDGYALIRKVRALDPAQGGRTPAVALTAYTRVEDRVRALSAGFQVHVAKPIAPAELVAVLLSFESAQEKAVAVKPKA